MPRTAHDLHRLLQRFGNYNEGDFARPNRSAPYSLVLPRSMPATWLYVTRPPIVQHIFWDDPHFEFGILSRGGTPSEAEATILCDLLRGSVVGFLGDLDPPDILKFAWLQEAIQPCALSFLGISDALLKGAGVGTTERIAFAMADLEALALPVLTEYVPNLAELVGPRCHAVISESKKCELEGVLSFGEREKLRRYLKRQMKKIGT